MATLPKLTTSLAYGATGVTVSHPTGCLGVIKAGPGSLYSVHIANKNASARTFVLFNNAAGTSGTFIMELSVPPGGWTYGRDFFGTAGLPFDTGISFGISTGATLGTFSAATNTDHTVNATVSP